MEVGGSGKGQAEFKACRGMSDGRGEGALLPGLVLFYAACRLAQRYTEA